MPALRRSFVLVVGWLVVSSAAWAQINRGTITGIVTDSSGAVVPNVAITISNTGSLPGVAVTNVGGTGLTNNTVSNGAGVYTVPNLPIGTYRVDAEKTGFKKYQAKNIVVNIGETRRVDITLALGSATQTVTVSGTALALQSETSDLSTTVTEDEVEDLPLTSTGDQRTPADFVELAPGTTGHGPSENFNTTGENMSRTYSTSVSGSMVGSTSFAVDGADIVTPDYFEGLLGALQIPPDAVDEFRLEATNGEAEYGRSAGGEVNFNIKSGTNHLHGDAYEYNRNTAFAANNFFINSAAPGCNASGHGVTGNEVAVEACRPPYQQNEFGVTAGGPIKKDKLFAFGWYNDFRLVQGVTTGFSPTPTAAMKQGNFQAYTLDGTPNTALVPLYDPSTKTLCGPIICNNIVNSADIDPVSQKVIPYFPAATNTNGSGINNYSSGASNVEDIYEWGIKGDYQMNQNNRLSGVFFAGKGASPNIALIPAPLGGGDQESTNLTRNIRVNLNTILGPAMTNQLTLSWNQYNNGAEPVTTWAGKSNWTSYLGLQGTSPNYPTEFPQIVIGGYSYNGGGGAGFTNDHSSNILDNITWIKGKHTFKFGGQFLNAAINEIYTGRTAGWYNYLPQETGLPGTGGTGIAFASFLLGYADEAQDYHENVPNYPRDSYWGFYGQDDWKLTKKITLNLGMRWDIYIPATQKYNQKSWIDQATPNPGAPGYNGALYVANSANPSGENLYWNNLGPRVGVAYALNDKTVLRTSYGIFYAQGNGDRLNTPGDFVQGWNGTVDEPSPNGGITPGFIWGKQAFAPYTINLSPTAFNGGGSQYASAGVLFDIDRTDSMAPYAQNYQFDIERRLPGQMVLNVAYVGNRGTHLASRGLVPMDKMPPQYLSLGNTCYSAAGATEACTTSGATPLLFEPMDFPAVQAQSVVKAMPIDPNTGNHSPFPGFEALFGESNTSLGQALRQEPQYYGWHRIGEGVGMSNYNALQLKLEKRFTNGLSLLVSYTWSKTLTDGGAMFSTFSSEFGSTTPWNDRDQYTYSYEDIPDNLTISYVYSLPVGKGQHFLNRGGVLNQIIGGWKTSGILTYESGRPQNIQISGVDNGLEDQGWQNVNRVNGVPMASAQYHWPKKGPGQHFDPNVDSQLNPAAFALPCQFCFGTLTPTEATVRDFPWYEEDMSILKDWTLHESWVFDFHADFINAFNRAVFGNDSGSYASEPVFGQPGFGSVASQVNYPRIIQFGARLKW